MDRNNDRKGENLERRSSNIQRSFSTEIPKSDPNNESNNKKLSWLQKFFGERKQFEKYSAGWWWDQLVVIVVFAITGSATVYFVKPVMKDILQLEGSLKDGPWSYRLIYFPIMMPLYSLLLLAIGTLFGRHHYFKKFALRMWSRFLPKSLKK